MSVVLVAVAAIVAAGCGGSSSTTTSVTTTGSGAAAASSAASSAAAATSAAEAAASSTQAAAELPSWANVDKCQQLAEIGTTFAQALHASKPNLQAAVNALQSLAKATPSEISPDVQLLAQTSSNFASALAKSGYTPGQVPTASQIADVQTAAQGFTQPQVRAAEQHVSAWAHQNCAGLVG